jgi:2-oxo-4-hydroxy-4-carboxy--5-ureidoimidazoline (OHCU) decarboxylase
MQRATKRQMNAQTNFEKLQNNDFTGQLEEAYDVSAFVRACASRITETAEGAHQPMTAQARKAS